MFFANCLKIELDYIADAILLTIMEKVSSLINY